MAQVLREIFQYSRFGELRGFTYTLAVLQPAKYHLFSLLDSSHVALY